MPETIIMVRVRLHPEDLEAAGAYAQAVKDALRGVDGFQGFGVWQSAQDSLMRLILFSYASPEAAKQGLIAVSERRSLVERQGYGSAPADVLGLSVIHAEGSLSGGMPHGASLSISIRIAEPGRSDDLADNYLQIFAGLGAIPGFAGYLVGVNESLPEEIVGLAAWDDEASFRISLPRQLVYQVNLYEPVYIGS